MKEHWAVNFLFSEREKADTAISNFHYLSVKGVRSSRGVFPKYS